MSETDYASVSGDVGASGFAGGASAALEAWLAVARPIEAAQQRIESALGDRHALCLTAYEVMECLTTQPGWTAMSVVCATVGRSQPRLSRLVAQMEDRGLVDREKVPGDKRAFQIRLTSEGEVVFQAASGTLAEALAHIAAQEDSAGAALRDRLRPATHSE